VSEHITVSAGQMPSTLALINGTALRGCTTLDSDDIGRVIVVRKWPGLSSGEELLWRCLDWVNGGSDLPAWDDLEAGLSSDNLPTVWDVLTENGAGVVR
tara:strand:+ start:6329 stop:6625 length:297 start_codon:yes stop_codon:yes gene_type:complete